MSESKSAAAKSTAKPKAAVVKDTINRDELTRAVAVVAEVYRSNAIGVGVESHTAMTFDGEHLRANTFAAAVKFPFKSKFKTNVDGQTLAKIVSAFENHGADEIKVSIKGADMTLSSGRSNVEMVALEMDAGEVADMKSATKFPVDSETRDKIVLALSQALRSAPVNDIRYYLNGVHFSVDNGNLIVMASTGHLLTRVNTGIKGADKFDGLSLTRDTAESFISIASRIEGGDDEMLITHHKNGEAALFGWRFANGAEFCAPALETPESFVLTDALAKVKEMNTGKLPSVATPEGLIDALNAGKIAATNGSPVHFAVKGGVMSVKTGDINTGFVYRTTDIATELTDTEVAYDIALLLRVSKNPAEQIMFYHDAPLYIGDVPMYNNRKIGVQTFLMPMRV